MPLTELSNGEPLFFAHVPKTGGSSVEDYLLRRFGALWFRRSQAPGPHPGLIQPVQHLTAADLADMLPPDIAHVFAVVRDPVKRLKSEFRFQQGHSLASRLSFSTWLRLMLAAARHDPRVYDNHIRPQSDLIADKAKIFRLEDGLEAVIAWLDDISGAPTPEITMPHIQKSSQAPVPHTRQDLDLIQDFYAADYDRFGYALPEAAAPDDPPDDPWAGLRGAGGACLGALIAARQRRRWR